MEPDKEKAPLRGEANSINFDLPGWEIENRITDIQLFHNPVTPPKIRALLTSLVTAIDEVKYPILAKHMPGPTRQDILRRIRQEMEGAL